MQKIRLTTYAEKTDLFCMPTATLRHASLILHQKTLHAEPQTHLVSFDGGDILSFTPKRLRDVCTKRLQR